MTLTELYKATLRKLSVLPAGGTPDHEDVELVKEAHTALCDYYAISPYSVLTGTGLHIAQMLAADLSDDFSLTEQKVQRLLLQRRQAERELLKIITDGYDTDTVIESEAY